MNVEWTADSNSWGASRCSEEENKGYWEQLGAYMERRVQVPIDSSRAWFVADWSSRLWQVGEGWLWWADMFANIRAQAWDSSSSSLRQEGRKIKVCEASYALPVFV